VSAVEGLGIATTVFEPFVVPITVVILIVLFILQNRGTAGIGAVFGPIMILWFITIAVVAVPHIVRNPVVFTALNPAYGASFLFHQGLAAFLTLGAVFLSVTGPRRCTPTWATSDGRRSASPGSPSSCRLSWSTTSARARCCSPTRPHASIRSSI
jgi:hypothetical protein